jgi:hypothetical protein
MLKRMARHAVVGAVLATVAGIAAASSLGYVGAPTGSGEITYLETQPVLRGDLGEIVVTGMRLADRETR